RNQEANLASQEQNLLFTQGLFDTMQATTVQVDQTYLSVQGVRLGLISARASFETSLDNYKILLGLPPNIPLRLDDSLLAQFQLTDPVVDKLKDDIDAFKKEFRQPDQPPPLARLQEGFRRLKENQAQARKLMDEVDGEIKQWKQLPTNLDQDKADT